MLIFILGYAALLAALGAWLSRSVRSAEDFFVARRGLSTPLLFSTFLAANLGAGTTVGAAEFGYRSGLSAWWWVGSAGIGSIILGLWIGPRVYRVARRNGLYTVGDYLELRYDRRTRLTTAALLWVGSLAILAGQLIAMGVVLHVVAGLDPAWGCALGGLIVTVYFTAGGLRGSAWIHLLQVAVKIVGFSLAIYWALDRVGGVDGLFARARALAPDPGAYVGWTGIGAAGVSKYAVILIPSFFVSPGLIQKIFGARDEGVVRRAVTTQGLVLMVYSFMPVALGMVAFTLWPDLENPAAALPKLLADAMPRALGALMLAALFSAEISSADAVLFMLSTSFSRDFVQAALGKTLDERSLLRSARWTAVAAGAAGTALAIASQSILATLTIFYTLLTVTLFAPLTGGLLWRRPRASAALASTLVGVPATLAAQGATAGAGWGVLNPAACGILAGGAAFVVVAILDRADAKAVS